MRVFTWIMLTLGWTCLIVSLAANVLQGTQIAVIGLGFLLSAVILGGQDRKNTERAGRRQGDPPGPTNH